MRLTTIMCFALLSLCTLGCGGSEEEQGIKELISLTDRMTTAVEKNDEAAAIKILDEVKSLTERMKKLKPSTEEAKRLQEKYQPELQKATSRLQEAVAKNPQMKEKVKNIGSLMR